MIDKTITLLIIGAAIGIGVYFLTSLSLKKALLLGISGSIVGGATIELLQSSYGLYTYSPLTFSAAISGFTAFAGGLISQKNT